VNQVAIRAINAGVGLSPLDVLALLQPAGTTVATFANLAFGTASDYTLVTTGPLALRARTAGTTTTVVADVTAPAGIPASGSDDPIAGSTVGGSMLTAIVVPRAVAGSQAGNFTTPAIIYLLDNRPPRPSS
jgi:hypothetical protein